MTRLYLLVILGLSVSLCAPRNLRGDGQPARNSFGRRVTDFSLPDTAGRIVRLGDFKDKKTVVIVFIGTECPINNASMPRLVELAKAYANKGVQFIAINSNSQDSAEAVAAHAKKYFLSFPVLKDQENKVADRLAARRTPEAFVLDAERKIRYQGRIDDQFGVGFTRPRPTRRDLATALDEVLAGQDVTQGTTEVAGCPIARAVKAKGEGNVTYSRQVARILQNNCQECHRPGQVGPMALLSYEDASAWSETIREVIRDKRMPPWYADPRYGKFANDRTLSVEDRATLLTWIDEGCPRGDDRDLPPPRQFPSDWRIGKPDMIFTMNEEYEVPAVGPRSGIPYKYFEVETNFKEDRWVVSAEARAGANSVVHHIIGFIVPPGHKFIPEQGNAPLLCGTAPGDMPAIMPPGTGKRIPAGAKIVFQMHYTPNGVSQKDRSSIGVIFAKEKPASEVHAIAVANMHFRIPPGDSNFKLESTFRFPADARILTFMPHMHLRGKDVFAEAIYPDGKKETLLSVPHYSFGWQQVYRLAKPLVMPRGSRIHFVAHFDNSAGNPNNPDPTQWVSWGDQTWEEMLIGWTDVVFERKTR